MMAKKKCGAEKDLSALTGEGGAENVRPMVAPAGEGVAAEGLHTAELHQMCLQHICEVGAKEDGSGDAVPNDLVAYAKEFASMAAEQLYLQLQRGDLRAIKLYYDLEAREKRAAEDQKAADGTLHLARIGAIRRAVFGDDAMDEDCARAEAVAAQLATFDADDGAGSVMGDGADDVMEDGADDGAGGVLEDGADGGARGGDAYDTV